MTEAPQTKVLITGATGQVGSKTIDLLRPHGNVEIVAAVRSKEKAAPFSAKGIGSVVLDLDDERTHRPALQGIGRLFVDRLHRRHAPSEQSPAR